MSEPARHRQVTDSVVAARGVIGRIICQTRREHHSLSSCGFVGFLDGRPSEEKPS